MAVLRLRPWLVWTLVIALIVTVAVVSVRTMKSNYITHMSMQEKVESSPVQVVESQLPQPPTPVVSAEPIVQPPADQMNEYDKRNLPLASLYSGSSNRGVPMIDIDESESSGMYSSTYGALLSEVEGLPEPPLFNPVVVDGMSDSAFEQYTKSDFGTEIEA